MRNYKAPIVEIKTIIKEDVLSASGDMLIHDDEWNEREGGLI